MNPGNVLTALALVAASSAPAWAQEPSTPPGVAYRAKSPPETRKAFFGELHLHTIMSFDAWTFGTKVTPDQAYRFARGETVMVPAVQVQAEQGIPATAMVPAKRAWPLDFTAVTDHSEYLGAASQLDEPESPFAKSPLGASLKAAGRAAFRMGELMIQGPDQPALIDMRLAAQRSKGWKLEMKAADDNYRPGKFTTFVAYEWTASSGYGNHMHRNVIFNSDHAPAPYTSVDSSKPEDLWKYLAAVRREGIDVLAIPHSSNLSDGRDFDWNMSDGKPIDAAYAMARALNEPLVEISQVKGSSDTNPELSSNDEFANFEIRDELYRNETKPNLHGSYVREAYGRGLIIRSKVGANPFKMGVVGGSDIHNGLSVSDESGFAGGFSGIDPKTMSPQGAELKRVLGMGAKTGPAPVAMQNGSAGITGVWAEENTRNAIFAALKRKETFGTSGTRIRVRMFGGWGFAPNALRKPDWVAAAYVQGVPMGADLPTPPDGRSAPRFVVQAMKDPDGANLDRIQIIKVWLAGKDYKEKVFDVALSGGRRDNPRTGRAPLVGNTVNLATGAYTNSIGVAQLAAVWRDPEFDPATTAVYYARVLEIPTPRWTTLLAIRSHLPIPDRVASTIQERAWTSPIWFTPPKS